MTRLGCLGHLHWSSEQRLSSASLPQPWQDCFLMRTAGTWSVPAGLPGFPAFCLPQLPSCLGPASGRLHEPSDQSHCSGCIHPSYLCLRIIKEQALEHQSASMGATPSTEEYLQVLWPWLISLICGRAELGGGASRVQALHRRVMKSECTLVRRPVVPRNCLTSLSRFPFSCRTVFFSWTKPLTLASAACSFSLHRHWVYPNSSTPHAHSSA